MVSKRGIDANLDKIKAILMMPDPKIKNDVEKLAKSLTAVGRFVLGFGDTCKPFFEILKKKMTFEWTIECHEMF